MEKEKIINKVISICIELKIFKYSDDITKIKNNIRMLLGDVIFIENIYNIIFIKAKQQKILHTKRVEKLLIELEKIRIELEN